MFDNVYLCVQKDKYDSYKCSYFGSVLEADNYFNNHYGFSGPNRVNQSFLISVPHIIPRFFHGAYCRHYIRSLVVKVDIEDHLDKDV